MDKISKSYLQNLVTKMHSTMLDDLEIITPFEMIPITFNNYQVIFVKPDKVGFYCSESSQTWKPLEGISVDYEKSFCTDSICFHFIQKKWNERLLEISRKLGGGRWFLAEGLESKLNFVKIANNSPYTPHKINKFIDSIFLQKSKRHRLGFFLFL